MSKKNTGSDLWQSAKEVIPGGNMLLSKRPEMFLPGIWPSYFSRAKGCEVWDLDGVHYYDMALMSVGTNTLGYGNIEVDAAVLRAVNNGNMSTLNCPEEVFLAEALVEAHDWADMARFCRTGGEANAVAIRIGRAASGRDGVAICGYHGWHDWYLAANLGVGSELNAHHLPNLAIEGVPKDLQGSIFPFEFNNLQSLEKICAEENIGVIKMEVYRGMEPNYGFLDGVRSLADRNGIVLVFDECTSGFRETFGGLHKKYGVAPDLAVFGKALGNGYAITAVVGKRDVMDAAQKTFISSTFWTERIGSAAGLKTLDEMQKIKSWEVITSVGRLIQEKWTELAELHNLELKVFGLPAISNFKIEVADWNACKTFITQEMLKSGFLATNAIFTCTEHRPEILDQYFDALNNVFYKLARIHHDDQSFLDYLDGDVCHTHFRRV